MSKRTTTQRESEAEKGRRAPTTLRTLLALCATRFDVALTINGEEVCRHAGGFDVPELLGRLAMEVERLDSDGRARATVTVDFFAHDAVADEDEDPAALSIPVPLDAAHFQRLRRLSEALEDVAEMLGLSLVL